MKRSPLRRGLVGGSLAVLLTGSIILGGSTSAFAAGSSHVSRAGFLAAAEGPLVFTLPTSIPRGDVNRPYGDPNPGLLLVASGGTAPYLWSVSNGQLPAGLTLNAATGLISGTPTTPGTSPVTITVTDEEGLAQTRSFSITVRTPSTTTVGAPSTQLGANEPATFTATVNPAAASGLVTFYAEAISGPSDGETFNLGSATNSSGSPTISISGSFPSYGTYNVYASYSGNLNYTGSASPTLEIDVNAQPGDVLITEMRLSGPQGGGDEYIELTNVSSAAVPLAGMILQTVENGPTILPADTQPLPAGGTFLVAGPNYSLGTVAPADFTSDIDFGFSGVALIAPDPNATQVDAVGTNDTGYHLGQGLAELDPATATSEYGWVRTQQTGSFKNTGSNAADFALVSTNGSTVGGVQSMLGSPSPTGLTTPWNRSTTVTSALLSPSQSADVVPNRVVTKTAGQVGGKLETRRVITNTTNQTINRMQLRLIDLSEANGLPSLTLPPSTVPAHLRAVPPATPSGSVTVGGQTVATINVSPAAPSVGNPGGGLNSTFPVPLPAAGLTPGQSVTVVMTYTADTSGRFWFRYTTEALFDGS